MKVVCIILGDVSTSKERKFLSHIVSLDDMIRSQAERALVFPFEHDGRQFNLVLVKDRLFSPLTSGPPAYVFNEEGILEEWSIDIGDDTSFAKKWNVQAILKRSRKQSKKLKDDNKSTPPPLPRKPSTPPAEVDIKSVSPNAMSVAKVARVAASSAIATFCGEDPATADRYEERNNALRSIARERNLSTNDVAALVSWLASTNDALRVERLAALKNDVMNLLRSQITPPPDFADTLVAMFEGGDHPPAVLDYCIQHLGALQGDIKDNAQRLRIRALFVEAAGRTNQPYAGTALYALAEDDFATPDQEAELRRLTLALCSPDANAVARIAAVQLAGERGYAEALPLLRATLSSARRDAVTDVVCIGSLGLLGDAGDLPLLQRFAVLGPRYAPAAETAIRRIEEREGGTEL